MIVETLPHRRQTQLACPWELLGVEAAAKGWGKQQHRDIQQRLCRSSFLPNPKGQRKHKHKWTPQSKSGALYMKDGISGQKSQILRLIYLASANFPASGFSSRPSRLSCFTQILLSFIDLCETALIQLFSSAGVLAGFLSPCEQSWFVTLNFSIPPLLWQKISWGKPKLAWRWERTAEVVWLIICVPHESFSSIFLSLIMTKAKLIYFHK